MERFLDGFNFGGGDGQEIYYLNRIKDMEKHVAAFAQADNVILIFPLYTDAMPGIVKHFIEALEPLCGRSGNPPLGFIVQSGFPEPIHSRYVARYLEKLARRLGCPHSGTAVRGGVEGIRIQPPFMTKKVYGLFYELGRKYAETDSFDIGILRKLAPRERLSSFRRLLFNFLKMFGLTDFYWNMMLKKYKAYDKRFARPFKDI
jgi:hypothetical protein